MGDHMTFQALQREAEAIAREYKEAGYDMTLRQLYYQLVARGMVPNSQRSYKRVGSACVKARLAGWFDMDLLVDRSRTVGLSKATDYKVDVDAAEMLAENYIQSVPNWCVRADRWFGQKYHVSVWVEKEALAGVFDRPCDDLGVGLFACKGYPSISALWQWLQGITAALYSSQNGADLPEGVAPFFTKEAVVLYFGDHDPDGWQIPRSAENTLSDIRHAWPIDCPPVRFKRVALNMDQISEHDPPPFMAKYTSSRYQGYLEEHGTDDAWELDALTPDILDAMIRDEINALWDPGAHRAIQARVDVRREELRGRMRADGWMGFV